MSSTPLPPAPCIAPYAQRGTADGVDMGTSFDCFDVRSRTEIRKSQQSRSAGGRNCAPSWTVRLFRIIQEWWHYTRNRARGTVYFDFPIPKR